MIYALDGIAPRLDSDTWVAPDANLIGKIVLEAGNAVQQVTTQPPPTPQAGLPAEKSPVTKQ